MGSHLAVALPRMGVVSGNLLRRDGSEQVREPITISDTGGWYGKSFVDWCYRGMDVLERSGGRPPLIYPHRARTWVSSSRSCAGSCP